MSARCRVDLWYGHPDLSGVYGADAFWSDTDCIYRGNIYDERGRAIGDYESPDSAWISKKFRIRWKE